MFKNESLDHRQWIILFIAGVTLCALFFALGLFVGKWSAGRPTATNAIRSSNSLTPAGDDQARPTVPESRTPVGGLVAPSSTDTESSMKPSSGEPSTPATDSAEPNSTESTSRTTSSGSEAASRAVNDRTSKNFSVRAGAFDQAQEAEELAKTLRSRGFVSAYTEKSLSETGNPRFLVMLGPWVDRESAIRTMNELRNQGLSNVVIIGQP